MPGAARANSDVDSINLINSINSINSIMAGAPAPSELEASGDETIVRLYSSLEQVVQGMVARTGRPDLEANSILLRVITRWLPQKDRWRHRSDEARRYLITCLRHEITNDLRRRRLESIEGYDGVQARSEPIDSDDRLIREALAAIAAPEDLRRIAAMRVLDDRSWAQIGAALGISEGQAKTIWSRKRVLVVKQVIGVAAGQLGALNHVIAKRMLAEGTSAEATAEVLGLDASELLDRLECEIIPTLQIRLGASGLEFIERAGRLSEG